MTVDATRLGLWLRRPHRPPPTPPATGMVVGFNDSGAPVLWPAPSLERASHLTVLAGSGAGKTVMVANALAAEMAERPTNRELAPALFVIDPKGDLVEHLLIAVAARVPARLADVVYLDPFQPEGGFPFNLNQLALGATPLDIRALQLANLVAEVSTASGSQRHLGVGARQVDVLTNVILGALAVEHPRASLLLALDALSDQRSLRLLGAATRAERARQFLLTAQLGDELRVSSSSRLRLALGASESLTRMVGASGCIQFGELIAPGRIVLVDLGRPIGGLTSLQTFYANLVGRLAIEELLARPSPWRGHHCRTVVDECQIVAPVLADRAESILTTGRSRGISLTTISQGTTLIDAASNTLLRVLMTNTPTKFIGRLAAPDAELLAREQAPQRGIEERLGSFRDRFAASVTNFVDREFFRLTPGGRERFRTADVDLGAWEAAALRHEATIAAVRGRLTLRGDATRPLTLAELAPPRPERGRRASSGGAPTRRAVAGAPNPAANRAPRSRWG